MFLGRELILLPVVFWMASLFVIQILGCLVAPNTSGMPTECPENSENCARDIMILQASPVSVHAAAMDWINDQLQTTVIESNETSSHSVFRTRWMAFPDDVYIEAGCVEDGTWMLVHSKSRLGISDMGVNANRIESLFAHLEQIEFEPYDCP